MSAANWIGKQNYGDHARIAAVNIHAPHPPADVLGDESLVCEQVDMLKNYPYPGCTMDEPSILLSHLEQVAPEMAFAGLHIA
ncbi:hypothetical protein CEXT_467081 [Caerostris extrusa]|uniref:Uncharacterized protein n=1 Tax=Caerostris extrusa TaxID=172846 RepID=A0AAV4WET2_CAEEX|nr:hypothetical protein CEXT_467081 [Caerostris extrusa]